MTAPATAPAPGGSAFRQVRGLDVLTWPAFDPFGVDVMVTTRRGGVSSGPFAALNLSLNVGDAPAGVLENRRLVAAALGADPADFVFAEQVHGGRATVVGAAERGLGTRTPDDAISGTDALVTGDAGTVLAVLAADCVPIVLYDPARHVIACAHAGWRGTVARVAASAVRAMESLGTRPGDVIAGIGPAVAGDRYEVGAEVFEAAERCLADASAQALRSVDAGRWLFDLPAANRVVLREAGVPEARIHVTDVPTGPVGPGWFFSHRAERPCGRFALVARLRPRESGGSR